MIWLLATFPLSTSILNSKHIDLLNELQTTSLFYLMVLANSYDTFLLAIA